MSGVLPKRTSSRTIGGLVGVAVSLTALVLVAALVNIQQSLALLGRANLPVLLGVVPVLAAQIVLRSIRWRRLLVIPSATVRPPVGRIAPVLLVGYLANVLLPARLGEAVRALLLARREHLDPAGSLGTVLLERVLDTASLAAVALAAASIADAPAWLRGGLMVVTAGATVVAAVLVTGSAKALSRRLESAAAERGGVVTVVAAFAHRGAAAADGRGRAAVIAGAIGLSVVCWMLDATTFWIVGQALRIELSPASAILVAAVTVLGTAVPSAPGYLGTFDVAATAAATALGVDPASALALAVLAHAVTVLPVAGAGAVTLSLMGFGLRNLAEAASEAQPERIQSD